MSSPAPDPRSIATGKDRYVNFAQQFAQRRLAATQKRILQAITENQRVLIVSGNGVGKSYGVAVLIPAFLYSNPDSVVLGTSGSYGQFIDTMWSPMSALVKEMKEEHDLPGQIYEGNKPGIKIDDEWFFNVTSPRDPGELEGRHGPDVLVVIEEADKEYITPEHFDSAGSSITDMNDKMVAIANPPTDETDIVYELMQPESRWEVIQFSSFESHNVQADLGNVDEPHIPGLTDLITIADDWEAWNDVDWPETPDDWEGVTHYKELVDDGEMEREELIKMLRPGATKAMTAHNRHEDLDVRWYRRRLGQIPPDSAMMFRPFEIADVKNAFQSTPDFVANSPQGVGIDVARKGGDYNVIASVHGDVIKIHNRWKGTDHNQNEEMIRKVLQPWDDEVIVAIDASPEGSGLADRVSRFAPGLRRFMAGSEAADNETYYDKWTEGLYQLGQYIKEGGTISNRRLREEMFAAARNVELSEEFYKSRETDVYKASKKENVAESLGRSPDVLDAAYMAAWAASDAPHKEYREQRLVW